MAKTIITIEDTDLYPSGVNVQVLKPVKVNEDPNADTPANRLAALVEVYIKIIHTASLSSRSTATTAQSTTQH